MASRTVIHSDLSGETPASTTQFSIDGQHYEIDLTDPESNELAETFAPYVTAGRKVGKTKSPGSKGGGPDNAKVRDWAREAGYVINERGRIPGSIVTAYEANH